MNGTVRLRKYRVFWVTIPVLTFAILFFLGAFKPISLVAEATLVHGSETQVQRRERSLFERNRTTITAVHETQMGAELAAEFAAKDRAGFAGASSAKLSLGSIRSQNGVLDMDEPIRKQNFFERLYSTRPYAGAPKFDPKMRFENDFDNPFRHETKADYERIRDARNHELRDWSKHATREQARDIVEDADQESAPIRALHVMKGLFGGGDLFRKQQANKRMSVPLSRRNDGSIEAEDKRASVRAAEVSRVYLSSQDRSQAEEPEIETRLRTKMNVGRRQGRLELQNEFIIPSAQLDLRAEDKVEVKAKKEIKSIALDTSVSYGIQKKTVAMNVNKKLTDELSCEVRSLRSERKDVVKEESVRLNFNVFF